MFKKIPVINKKVIYILLAVAVLFAVFQSFMVLNYYESDVYLYAHGTPLPTVFNVLLSVFVIAVMLLFCLSNCDKHSENLAKSSLVTRIFALLCGGALVANGIYCYSVYSNRAADMLYLPQKQDKFLIWSVVLAFAGCIYFVLCAVVPEKLSSIKTFVGCITLAWHIVYLLTVYFDMTSPLNSPVRLMNEFALVGVMMYLTAEIRFLCKIPKKGFYIGVSVVSFTLLLCSSVSNLLYVASGKAAFDGSMIIFVYQLLAAGYVLTRLLSQIKTEE